METLDLVATGVGMAVGKGIGTFFAELFLNGESTQNFDFCIAGKVNTTIGHHTVLDLKERHFHTTIDIDLKW